MIIYYIKKDAFFLFLIINKNIKASFYLINIKMFIRIERSFFETVQRAYCRRFASLMTIPLLLLQTVSSIDHSTIPLLHFYATNFSLSTNRLFSCCLFRAFGMLTVRAFVNSFAKTRIFFFQSFILSNKFFTIALLFLCARVSLFRSA